jgi:hypothetical protein
MNNGCATLEENLQKIQLFSSLITFLFFVVYLIIS